MRACEPRGGAASAGTGSSELRALVLSEFDLDEWREAYRRGDRPTALPYGLEQLGPLGYRFGWTSVGRGRLATKLRNVVEHRLGASVEQPLRAIPRAARADLVIALLEREGRLAALMRRFEVPPYGRRPLVLLAVWLAERLSRLPVEERRAMASPFLGVDLLIHPSPTETDILLSAGFRREQLHAMTFGVADDFYRPGEAPQDIDFLAVGQDLGRDYRTLVEAVRGTDLRVDLVCRPVNIEGIDLPDNVVFHGTVDHKTYGDMLRRAKTVVIPTTELTYPTGSSVALEASACGAAIIVTGTAAMREYFVDRDNGILVDVGDVDGLRAALDEVAADDDLRASLGASARQAVETRFNTRAMWRDIEAVLRARGIV